jgi:hypothetical protein
MRAFEFLIEYGGYKGVRPKKYRDGGKPPWYEKAVKLKTDNPRMSASEIGRLVGRVTDNVLNWLAGKPDPRGIIYNDNPPFTMKDFPMIGNTKYFGKPWWYEEAVALRKQGMTYPAIANKLSTLEEKVTGAILRNWLVKGKTQRPGGKLVNKDAPFTPIPYNTKKDTAEIEEFIDAGLYDADIIKYIQDKKGDKIAGEVRAMLPKLRRQHKASKTANQVIDKKTGQRQDWVVQ